MQRLLQMLASAQTNRKLRERVTCLISNALVWKHLVHVIIPAICYPFLLSSRKPLLLLKKH